MNFLTQFVPEEGLFDILQSPEIEMFIGSLVIKSALLGVGLGLICGVYKISSYLSLPYFKTPSLTTSSVEERIAPKHLAVIMDGNRRFGKKEHSDPLKGHWSGGQTLIDFVHWCIEDGVEVLTVYAFSTENWLREELEVNTLMIIISKYAKSFQKEALAKNVKVNVLCTDKIQLPDHVRKSINELESATNHCDGFVFNICLSYGGRADIVQACQKAATDVSVGKITIEEITEQYFNMQLLTEDTPAPDMLIRTSGEYRVSNFLLWQIAYTELFFIKKLWPEINQRDLRNMFSEFQQRKRRFGK